VTAGIQATDERFPRFDSRTLAPISVIASCPFCLHCSFEIRGNLELFGEMVIVKITGQRWIEVAESDNAGVLVDFSFERCQKTHSQTPDCSSPFKFRITRTPQSLSHR
jgi:hypothetical protein